MKDKKDKKKEIQKVSAHLEGPQDKKMFADMMKKAIKKGSK